MLNRIRVKNFKSFKNLDYNCAKLNLLTGVNGSGKSSFVQLLLLLRAISAKLSRDGIRHPIISTREIGFTGKFADIRYCYAKADDDIKVDLDFTTRRPMEEDDGLCEAFDFEPRYGISGSRKVEPMGISLIMRPCPSSSYDFEIIDSELEARYLNSPEYANWTAFLNKHGGGINAIVRRAYGRNSPSNADDDMVYKEMKSLRKAIRALREKIALSMKEDIEDKTIAFEELWWNMRMVSAFRIKPCEVHDAGEVHDVGYVTQWFNPEGDDVVEFLYTFGHSYHLSPKNPMRHRTTKSEGWASLMDEVNAWLGEVSPGAKINITSEDVGDEKKFVEAVNYGDGGLHRGFKPQNVGFGISYILPVLVALLTSQPEDIVIIENPEAHLHPRGQSEMGRLLACAAASGVQLFVETHSDHVINGVRVAIKEGVITPDDAKVAFFERGKHEVSSENGEGVIEVYTSERNILIDKNGALSEYPTDFLDEWNNQLMELM